jgi:hypothetical protein
MRASYFNPVKKKTNCSGGKWVLWQIIGLVGLRWGKARNGKFIVKKKVIFISKTDIFLRNVSRYINE